MTKRNIYTCNDCKLTNLIDKLLDKAYENNIPEIKVADAFLFHAALIITELDSMKDGEPRLWLEDSLDHYISGFEELKEAN